MTKQEKEELARVMLERNGYPPEQIEDILRYAFGDKKGTEDDDSQD